MVQPLLVGLHAALGELGVFAFLWLLVELLNPTKERIKRAKVAAVLGTVLLFGAWLVGGFYYVNYYGPQVKPIIKEGPVPWAHAIFMETKEHVFLFLPFLSVLTTGIIIKNERELLNNKKIKLSVLLLSGSIILIALSMAGMGYIISTGARTALETTA